MNVAVTGASGLIGSKLVSHFTAGGHSVRRVVRKLSGAGEEILWDPKGTVDRKGLEGIQAVIHLAGENIGRRWNQESKARMRDSRIEGTRTLCEALVALDAPPNLLVCASAIGYYGDRGDELLTEDSGPGKGFLASLCTNWEKAAEPAAARGIRTVHLRMGIVLDATGGALAKMLLPFRLGAGGRVGSGAQWWSWVAMDDVVGAFDMAVANESLRGGVNVTSPNPVTNAEFTRILARVLKRPAIFPLPAFAARMMMGEMANEMLLSSARAMPAALIRSKYQFRYPDLESALRHLL